MNFADEEYVRLYTSDTITWDMLPWQALALLPLALRKFDRSGVFEFGKHGAAVALSVKTRLPLDLVTAGLQAIVDSGTWTVSGTRIYWPTYIEAQTCRRSERIRKREERARKLNEQRPEPGDDSDKCHTEPPKTDKCHTASNVSHSVTPGEAGRRRGVGEAGQGILDSGVSDAREPAAQSELELPTFEVELPDSDASLPPVASDVPTPASDGAPRVTETRLRATSRELPAHVRNFERSMSGQSTKSTAAEALFEVYRSESGKTGARYDHKARDLFERLVDEGETPESVREVVRGAKLDPWARDTAKLAAAPLLSSADQREKYIAIAKCPPRFAGVKTPRRVQPNAVNGPMPEEWTEDSE